MFRKPIATIPIWYTVVLMLVMSAGIQAARAQVSVFTSQSAFDSVVAADGTGIQTITFEGIAPAGGFQAVSNPFTIQGVTFTGDTNAFININDSQLFSGSGYNYGTGATMGVYENPNGANGAFTASLPSGVVAVGFDVGDFTGDPVTISLPNGTSATIDAGTPFPGPGFNFIGFIDPAGISSVTVTPTSNTFGSAYDNFTYSTVVPEASGGISLAIGLLCLFAGIGYRRMRNARA